MDEPLDDLTQQRLRDVLQDFGRAPGKYPVRLGEPRELHAGLDTLTMWALGRLPKALEPQAEELRAAAVLFIARACFAPEATHYQLFGLTPGACTPDALRARYRNLIRLTHPDMGIKGLPSNAAGAVNRAHGVLSDPQLRRRYDEELADRKTPTGPASRKPAFGDGVRRIEHRVTMAERWQSLKARYPNLARAGAIGGGVLAGAVGLLVLAMTSQNDDRTLVAARKFDQDREAVPADPDRPGDGAIRGQGVVQGVTASVAKASPRPAPGTSDPRAVAPAPTSRSASTETSALPPMFQPAPPATTNAVAGPAPTSRVQNHAEATAHVVERPGSGEIVTDPSARLKTQPKPIAVTDSAPASPSERTTAEARRSPAGRPDASPPPSMAGSDGSSSRLAAATRPTPTPSASTVVAAPAPAPAPVSPSETPPVRTAATAPPSTPSPAPPATTAVAKTSAPASAPSAQVWNVDSTSALHYLSELIAMLETPTAAYRTNAYLTEMKVKGSLLRPALRAMRDFSEIDVSRVDWSDSTAPGVLRVRGTLVLQARGPQAPFSRTANFRLTAEFWGTPTGTVLAELNLREAE